MSGGCAQYSWITLQLPLSSPQDPQVFSAPHSVVILALLLSCDCSLGGQLFGFVFCLEGQCLFPSQLTILDKKSPGFSGLLLTTEEKKTVSLEKDWGQADAGQGWDG